MAASKLVRGTGCSGVGPLCSIQRRAIACVHVSKSLLFHCFLSFPLSLTQLLREDPVGVASDRGLTPRAHSSRHLGPSCRAGRKDRRYRQWRGPLHSTAAEKGLLRTAPASRTAPATVWVLPTSPLAWSDCGPRAGAGFL